MSVAPNLLYSVLSLYAWLIVARALLSWLHPRPGSALYRIDEVLHRLTEPYVGLFRRFLPTARLGAVGIDLSPMAALLVLFLVMQLLARL